MDNAEPRRSSGLRLTVLVITAVEIVLLLLLASTTLGSLNSSEQLGRSMSWGVLTVAGMLAVPVLIALGLALWRRWLWLALALSLGTLAVPILLFPHM